ncbi:MAG: alanyl-tRNA editing protein [[Eubacterium] brachy]|nr:threonine/alanine tRNA ligase second additional domain protein [Eubacterium brachy ATCC 33089]MBF1134217.1 alanyl-tRNA editing protein [[Eubacterium] brachy]
MSTIKLFQKNVYLITFLGTVIKIDKNFVALDQTAFFPAGGGQSCDKGTINNFTVTDVFESDNLVWHSVPDHNFKQGDTVKGEINWEHRFDNMQRHCGEHIMSGIWHKLYGGINRGFHMGANYMTVDIDLSNCNQPFMTQEMINNVELETNKVIWQNLPVISRHFDTKEEASNLPVRKPVVIEKDITIVSVGDISNPSDCVACCGTHPSHSGQVGLLKIFKFEKNKNMYRIYFDAGKRAFDRYFKLDRDMNKILHKFHGGDEDIMDKIESFERDSQNAKLKLNSLRNALVEIHCHNIEKEILNKRGQNYKPEGLLSYTNPLYSMSFSNLAIDDLISFNILVDKFKDVTFIFISCPDNTALILSAGYADCHCGDFVNAMRSSFTFKGGGGNTSARMKFISTEDLCEFMDSLTLQN